MHLTRHVYRRVALQYAGSMLPLQCCCCLHTLRQQALNPLTSLTASMLLPQGAMEGAARGAAGAASDVAGAAMGAAQGAAGAAAGVTGWAADKARESWYGE